MNKRKIRGDWWPNRDQTCHNSAYTMRGAEIAIGLCRKTDLVIQAGGNVGVWPRWLKDKFTRVLTFEPSKENYDLMVENLSISKVQVEMFHAALGEKAGKCGVKLNPHNCGDDQTIEGKDVPVIAIDDLSVDPDLIYLDIQGDELPALRGAAQTILRCYPVIALEVDGSCMRRHGDPRPYLKSLGYEVVDRAHQDEIFTRSV